MHPVVTFERDTHAILSAFIPNIRLRAVAKRGGAAAHTLTFRVIFQYVSIRQS